MIYLKNNTILQELYIPRQDYISNTTGSSGTYAEGYADGYESGYTSGSTDGFDSGYTSGSTDGYNSGYTEGYDSGSTDGFNSGYTSGETHQKGLLTSTEFTENGEYQREDGWSAVTVNVSGSVLEGKEIVVSEDITVVTPSSGYDGFSAVTVDATEYAQENYDSGFDDGYTDGYSSGSSEGYDSGYTDGYQSGYTSGSTDGYESGYTSGTTDGYGSGYTSGYTSGHTDGIEEQKALLTTTALTENGSYQRENGWSGVTVNVDTASTYQSGYTSGHTDGVSEEKAKLSATTFTANTAITLSDGGYSAITVNVPQSGSTEKDIVICTSGGCWFNMNYQIGYGDVFEIEHCTFGKAGVVSFEHQQYLGGNSGELFRIGQSDVDLYIKYFNNSIQLYTQFPQSGSIFEDNTIVYSSTAFTVDGNIVSSYTTNYSSTKGTLVVFANTTRGGDKVENQTAKIGRLKVYASDGTLKATFEPRLDEFNVPYFKYIEQDIDIYASGNTAPFYEEIIVDTSYQSGFTDGYNSGYTEGYNSGTTDGYSDGENAVISTFTAMTATTNGVYGSSAHPLSSITVNVPQSGGGGTVVITPVDYIHRTTLSSNVNNAYIDTLITPTTATTFRVVGMGKGYGQGNTIVGYQDNDSKDYRLFWYSTNGRNLCFDFNNERLQNSSWGGATNGRLIDITCNNYSVTSGDSQTPIMTGTTQSSIQDPHTIKIDVGTWWPKSLQIWDGQTLVFDGKAAYDDSGNIGLFDNVSKSLVYNSGLSMSYEIEGVSFSSITITSNTAITVSDGGYSAITVNVPYHSQEFGDLYCLYCDEDCIFDFPYTINSELASIDDINFSALPLSDFTIVYKGDLDGYDLKIGNMKWTDEGNGYYHFSGNWETYYNTYNTNDSTSRAINDFPNMHFFDWKIYATKTYSVDSDDLAISSGGGAPTHTSDLSISGNSYYLGNVSVDNQYCLWYVAVDSDGNGCLRMGNEYKYPRQGNCYPVYRKLVNGDYVYRVVKPISVGGV